MSRFSLSKRNAGKRVALVPTMGALHAGHLKLIETARALADTLVVSIFINPAQFGPGEDLHNYPKGLAEDMTKAEASGADIVFHPAASSIYKPGSSTWVDVEGPSEGLCGRSRPGHFRGVATVVLKLFNIVKPHSAVFGLKDYQQFVIIEKMVNDLNLDVELTGVDTVREADGLAMSSRNAYLSERERRAARSLPAALRAAEDFFSAGERDALKIIDRAKKIIEKEELTVIDYIELCDTLTLLPLDTVDTISNRPALLAAAVKVGNTRLIDNVILS